MPRTIEQVDTFMRDPAHRLTHYGKPWHNGCELFVNNAGGFAQAFGTALAAGNASGPLDPRLSTITDGSIGYWRGVWIRINGVLTECGHTAIWYRNRWEMASDAVTTMIGDGTGTISHADYARLRPAAIWRGHTKRHGTETLARSSTASTGTTTPLPAAPTRRNTMSTGYFTKRNGVTEWALAGDGQGDAAWIPVGNDAAQALAAVHGNFVELSVSSFDSFKGRYLSGGQVVNQTINSTSDPSALAKVLAAINALPVGIAAEDARRRAS